MRPTFARSPALPRGRSVGERQGLAQRVLDELARKIALTDGIALTTGSVGPGHRRERGAGGAGEERRAGARGGPLASALVFMFLSLQMPLAVAGERKGRWVFPREIIGSSAWLSSLWERRATLHSKPCVIAWGMKDIAFRKRELRRWSRELPEAKVVEYADCGHFVSEERPDDLTREIAALG